MNSLSPNPIVIAGPQAPEQFSSTWASGNSSKPEHMTRLPQPYPLSKCCSKHLMFLRRTSFGKPRRKDISTEEK